MEQHIHISPAPKTAIAVPIVVIEDDTLSIRNYQTDETDIVRHFNASAEHDLTDLLDRTLRVGAICLEKAQQSADLDFVKLRIEQMLREVEGRLTILPKTLAEQLGTDEGKVLHPVKLAIADVQKAVKKDLIDVRSLLEEDLDPHNPSSSMGLALTKIRNLLDPERTDSLPYKLSAELTKAAAADGPMAGLFRKVLTETLEQANKPMRESILKLEEQMKVDARVQEIVDGTALKGAVFEDALLEQLKAAVLPLGGVIEHVGGDNQPGDFVVEFGKSSFLGVPLRIVVEAKDDQAPKGRAKLRELLATAMSHRKAQAGLFIGKTPATFAKEIGELSEGSCAFGSFVAATARYLDVALRLVVALHRIESMQKEESFEKTKVQAQVQSIRSAIQKFASVRKAITSIDQSTANLRGMLSEIEDGLKSSLLAIELALSLPADAA